VTFISASSAETAKIVVDVADRLFTAIENSDMAAVDRLWSADIAVWRVGAHRDDDKARALVDQACKAGFARACAPR